jgi:hypothetical protein
LPDQSSKQLTQAMRWRLNLLDHNQKQEWQNVIQEIQTRITKHHPRTRQTTKHKKYQKPRNMESMGEIN